MTLLAVAAHQRHPQLGGGLVDEQQEHHLLAGQPQLRQQRRGEVDDAVAEGVADARIEIDAQRQRDIVAPQVIEQVQHADQLQQRHGLAFAVVQREQPVGRQVLSKAAVYAQPRRVVRPLRGRVVEAGHREELAGQPPAIKAGKYLALVPVQLRGIRQVGQQLLTTA
ncbi:hypothetical protein D3C71_1683580 [compost metagenome]